MYLIGKVETLRIAASNFLPSVLFTPVSTTRMPSLPTKKVELALPSLSEMYAYKPGPICLGAGAAFATADKATSTRSELLILVQIHLHLDGFIFKSSP